MQSGRGVVCHTAQDVGEPGTRVDVVHLGRDDEQIHRRGAFIAAVRSIEQPRLPDIGMAGRPGTGAPHPAFQLRHQRCHMSLPHGQALLCRQPIDGAFGIEDRIDPTHLGRQRCTCELRQVEQLASSVASAAGLRHRTRSAAGMIQLSEPGIGVGLQPFEQAACSPALGFRQIALHPQPGSSVASNASSIGVGCFWRRQSGSHRLRQCLRTAVGTGSAHARSS